MSKIQVVAAIIIYNDRFLITQRLPSANHDPLKWEFPGGKVDPGETHSQALIREIKEELGITIKILGLYNRSVFLKNSISIEISFYRCSIYQGKIQNIGVLDHHWLDKTSDLDKFHISDPDLAVAKKLYLDFFP
ncbi:MAG: (deoxy)nucleoside triphosphate pyrophosphohydrolase [Candidatus Bilamarchaeum sp.]|jgi:mutator protein MutT